MCKKAAFFHPDYTVASGIKPDRVHLQFLELGLGSRGVPPVGICAPP